MKCQGEDEALLICRALCRVAARKLLIAASRTVSHLIYTSPETSGARSGSKRLEWASINAVSSRILTADGYQLYKSSYQHQEIFGASRRTAAGEPIARGIDEGRSSGAAHHYLKAAAAASASHLPPKSIRHPTRLNEAEEGENEDE